MPISEKLPEELTNKTFVATVAKIIADWRLYLKEWRAELKMENRKEPYLRRGPSDDVDLRILKGGKAMTELQKEVVQDLVSMLRQTAFDWEDKSVLKGEGQLIKAVAPLVLAKKHTQALLETDAGWDMRCGIAAIMKQIVRKADGWHPWDGFDSKPASDVPMDELILVTKAAGEGSSSVIARTQLVTRLRERHTAILQKVVDSVMVDSLGIIGRDPVSGQGVADPRVHVLVSEFILASPLSRMPRCALISFHITEDAVLCRQAGRSHEQSRRRRKDLIQRKSPGPQSGSTGRGLPHQNPQRRQRRTHRNVLEGEGRRRNGASRQIIARNAGQFDGRVGEGEKSQESRR